MKDKISSFTGEYRFLSNFWPALVEMDGSLYPTVEHAYQAAKTRDNDEHSRRIIQALDTPGRAKSYARTIRLRGDWEQIKIQVMEGLLAQKFSTCTLGPMLERTWPKELIEGNTWGDTFWGVCKGVGHNHLGKLLMLIRDDNAGRL
jgi:N-glycosidase YbiA